MALGGFDIKNKRNAEKISSSGAGKPPSIGALLAPELILSCPLQAGRKDFVGLLVARLCAARGLGDPRPFLDRLSDREKGISTTLDSGLSVPHARMDGLPGFAAALGLVPRAMPDPDSEFPIRAVFVFFSPNRQDQFTAHLQLLRAAASLFSTDFIDLILADVRAEAVLRRISEKEKAV